MHLPILAHGSVVTWGDQRHGGDSSAVQDQLINVKQIQASGEAFAAILADQTVVSWPWGEFAEEVQDQLKNVRN